MGQAFITKHHSRMMRAIPCMMGKQHPYIHWILLSNERYSTMSNLEGFGFVFNLAKDMPNVIHSPKIILTCNEYSEFRLKGIDFDPGSM
jgi:hypothetical protein